MPEDITSATKPVCFVIAPVGEAKSPTRKRSDQVLYHIIKPVVTDLGYTPIQADKISETGIITSQILQHILEDALVVADLTDRNPTVLYEPAVRHATGKPIVQFVHARENIPSDVAGIRAIKFDVQHLDSVEQCKKDLRHKSSTFRACLTLWRGDSVRQPAMHEHDLSEHAVAGGTPTSSVDSALILSTSCRQWHRTLVLVCTRSTNSTWST